MHYSECISQEELHEMKGGEGEEPMSPLTLSELICNTWEFFLLILYYQETLAIGWSLFHIHRFWDK